MEVMAHELKHAWLLGIFAYLGLKTAFVPEE